MQISREKVLKNSFILFEFYDNNYTNSQIFIPMKKNKKNFLLTVFAILVLTFTVFGQETVDWIQGYSSQEFEKSHLANDTKEEKLYYFWQLESLKKAVSPRYIKIIDIQNYQKTGKLLNRGVLFTYNGLKNYEVSVCGNFNVWRCQPMQKNKFGIFYIVVPSQGKEKEIDQNMVYEYKFKVDGLFDYDSENLAIKDDGEGSYISYYTQKHTDFSKLVTYRIIEDPNDEDLDFRTVEFRIYLPQANIVNLVGNFNQWNPEHDFLNKDENGLFTLRKKLKPGEYLYNFIADGEKVLDIYNSETRYRGDTEELTSYLKVEDDQIGSSQ